MALKRSPSVSNNPKCLPYSLSKMASHSQPICLIVLLHPRSYWTHAILMVLLAQQTSEEGEAPQITINELCEQTSIKKEDVISTLQSMNLISYYKGQYILCLQKDLLEKHQKVKSLSELC